MRRRRRRWQARPCAPWTAGVPWLSWLGGRGGDDSRTLQGLRAKGSMYAPVRACVACTVWLQIGSCCRISLAADGARTPSVERPLNALIGVEAVSQWGHTHNCGRNGRAGQRRVLRLPSRGRSADVQRRRRCAGEESRGGEQRAAGEGRAGHRRRRRGEGRPPVVAVPMPSPPWRASRGSVRVRRQPGRKHGTSRVLQCGLFVSRWRMRAFLCVRRAACGVVNRVPHGAAAEERGGGGDRSYAARVCRGAAHVCCEDDQPNGEVATGWSVSGTRGEGGE